MKKTYSYPEYRKQWYQDNKESHNQYMREWYQKNKERLSEYYKKRRENNPEAYRKKSRDWIQRQRMKVIEAYGGPKCVCCGEDHIEFLSIDHKNGGGNAERKRLNKSGIAFYTWLIKQGFPEGYQVLCHNCNLAKGFYGYCPHKNNT